MLSNKEEKISFQACQASRPMAVPAGNMRKNSRVLYMPFLTGSCNQSSRKSIDESTFLHELAHAVRPHNFYVLQPLLTNDKWTDLEEFFAVMVENIYLSERGDKWVRSDHSSGDKKLPATRSASSEFMADKTNHARVKEALKRETLAQQLAKLTDVPFNPFAEFERARHDLRSI